MPIAPTAVRTEMNAYLLDDPGFLGLPSEGPSRQSR